MKIDNPKAPIIFLMGPTASGKTALAIALYLQNNKPDYEIISVDSTMLYQHLNIGSAKPSKEELAKAPHHLIDFIDPKDSYSASQFCSEARDLINDIHSLGKVPLLVGGTMLYFKALKDGLSDLPSTDKVVRNKIKEQLELKGIHFLHEQLSKFDPETAARLHKNDTQRITRALEVYQITGIPLSTLHLEQDSETLSNPLLSLALAPAERKVLHQRIESRFHHMMENGLLEEVTKLYSRGDLGLDCPSMRSVGYRQLWQHLNGEFSLSEAVEKAIIATRQLAKRQYTWLRRWPDIKWYDPTIETEFNRCQETIDSFIKAHRNW